jgi:hypothetical protein
MPPGASAPEGMFTDTYWFLEPAEFSSNQPRQLGWWLRFVDRVLGQAARKPSRSSFPMQWTAVSGAIGLKAQEAKLV